MIVTIDASISANEDRINQLLKELGDVDGKNQLVFAVSPLLFIATSWKWEVERTNKKNTTRLDLFAKGVCRDASYVDDGKDSNRSIILLIFWGKARKGDIEEAKRSSPAIPFWSWASNPDSQSHDHSVTQRSQFDHCGSFFASHLPVTNYRDATSLQCVAERTPVTSRIWAKCKREGKWVHVETVGMRTQLSPFRRVESFWKDSQL